MTETKVTKEEIADDLAKLMEKSYQYLSNKPTIFEIQEIGKLLEDRTDHFSMNAFFDLIRAI